MKIAIVKLSALGDIVHSMIVLQIIKKYNPEILIDWVVEDSYKELLEFHPDINKVFTVRIRKAKKKKSLNILFKELKKIRRLDSYDLVIDMQGLIKSAFISKLIPSKKTLGFDKNSIREKAASIFYDKSFNIKYDENIVNRNVKLIKFALDLPFDLNELNTKLPFLFSIHRYTIQELSKTKKNILLIPGASKTSKRYPAQSFARIAHSLDANFLVLWGNADEESIANEIQYSNPSAHICPKLSIAKLVFLISQVDLVIGSDTGPTHFAWALNIPSITLFGSTPGYRNSYETEINKIIESESKVDPYNLNRNDFSIKTIQVNEVVKIANYLLTVSI
jgi:heptosyltransferase I